jgi:hypothetical protein
MPPFRLLATIRRWAVSRHATTVVVASPKEDALRSHFGSLQLKAKRSYVGKNGNILRLGAMKELSELSVECNTIYWATAILRSTYDWIDDFDRGEEEVGRQRPFSIPRLQFVKAGLSCVLSPHGSTNMTKAVLERLKNKDSISPSFKFTYMLKEAIPGEFVKYIHNGDPRPILEPEEAPKEYELAQFLCFTQHLQYCIWEGVVFLSDYQGVPIFFHTIISHID